MIEPVVTELVRIWPDAGAILVVDDGSTDRTAEVAERAGASVLRHPTNLGKGAALRTGMSEARRRGFDVAVTVDADGQHPPAEALCLHRSNDNPATLLIGVRDLMAAGAPRANQLSNQFSNLVLSAFTGQRLLDTQCGLRRYPLRSTLALGGRALGYGYEAEILIRAVAEGVPLVHLPIEVIYPPEDERVSHFDSVRDPTRIVFRVLATVAGTRASWLRRKLGTLARPAPVAGAEDGE